MSDVDYRDRFYEHYCSTHVATRKGTLTRQYHEGQFRIWDKLIGPYLPTDRSATVVDLGCGTGGIVQWLNHLGYANAFGVDQSPECVSIAQTLSINVIQNDIRQYVPTCTALAEFVILRNVLEHHTKIEAVQLVCDILRSLKPGGRLFIQVPNSESPFGARTRYADYTHEQAFTRTSIAQLLATCGYTQIAVAPVPPFHKGIHWKLRWWLVEQLYLFLLKSEIGLGARPIVTQDLCAVSSRPSDVG